MIRNMKKIIGFLFSVIFCTIIAASMPQMAKAAEVAINETNFPDEIFRNYVKKYDTDNNNGLSESEIANVKRIDVSYNNITSLKGIEHFTALQSLFCHVNQLTALDLSKNTALATLYCSENQLAFLDLSNNVNLIYLNCYNNKLTTLDLNNNTALTYLNCYNNKLTGLKLNSQTYNKLHLYKRYLHGDLSLSDLQNITETALENCYEISELKVTDITKPATYKVNGKNFTIIYTGTATMPSESPSPVPSETPSASPEPSISPSGTPSASPSPSPSPVVQSGAHIFSDYNYTSPVASDAPVIYGNGINKKINGKRVNNKTLTLYTDILASYNHVPNSNGTVKSTVGKVIAAVTKTNVKPEVNSRNKVTDTSAYKIARAKIKNGQITVTAVGKEGGLVYLWVIDTGSKGVSASCPIDVKLAPKKLEVRSTSGTKLTNTKLKNGTTLDVHITGFAGTVKTEDCKYTTTVDPKYQSYVQIVPKGAAGQDFTITAKGLKNNKDTKAAITFTCDQNGKKVKFSLTIIK